MFGPRRLILAISGAISGLAIHGRTAYLLPIGKVQLGMQRMFYVCSLIVQGMWCLSMLSAAVFAYLCTTVAGRDGAGVLPLTAWSIVFGGLAVASAVSCWQTARTGPRIQPVWWISAVFCGEVLMLLALAVPALVAAHLFFSEASGSL